jgi:phage FluMu protein gp41
VAAAPATSIGPTRATLNGTVNPGGDTTRVSVGLKEIATGDSIGAAVDTLRTALESDQSVSLTTPDTLRPSTEYRYRIVATNSVDTLVSGPQAFTTDNVPPSAANDTAATDEDTAVTVDVLANDRDPGGALDPSTVTVVAPPATGATSVDASTGQITYTPTPDSNGTDRFDYAVADDSSATDTATVVINVAPVDDPPVARADPATSIGPTRATLNGTVNPGGDTTRVSVGLKEIATGDSIGAAVDTLRTALESDQSVSLTTPDTLRPSTEYRYRIVATNSVDTLVSGPQAFTTDNVPPSAANDTAATDEDTAVTVDVLANDRDPGGALDPSTVTVVAPPATGATSVDASTGQITYTPTPDSNGTDRFDYAVADDSSATDTATVVINVAPVNDLPVARADTASVSSGDTTSVPVLANDRDVEGPLDTTSVAVVTGPANGTVLGTADGTISYTSDVGYTGPDSLRYTVDDTTGQTSEGTTVRIDVIDAALTAAPDTLDLGLNRLDGVAKTAQLAVTNTGTAALTGLTTSIDNADEFAVDGGLGTDTLAAGATLEVGVQFTPNEAQSREGTLAIRAAEGATVRMTLTGVGVSLNLQAGPARRGESAPAALTVEGESVTPTGTLYARPGGAARYQAFELQEQSTTPLRLEAELPDTMATPRGIDYYAVLVGNGDTLTVPAGGPTRAAARPPHLPVSFEQLTAPGPFAPEAYRMVTVPARPTEGVKAALENAYGAYDPLIWRLARWASGRRDYREYPQIDTLRPGDGFWVVTAEGEPLSIGAGQTVDASTPRRLPLAPGWNQVGSPFGFAVPWDTVRAASGLAPAEVDGPVAYREGEYRPAQSRLNPWEGYLVFNAQPEPDTLVIPPVSGGGEPKTEQTPSTALRADDRSVSADSLASGTPTERDRYTLRVEAATAETAATVWLGLRSVARPGRDALDVAQAPPIENDVRLSIREEIGGRSVPHTGSFKPPPGPTGGPKRGQAWTLRLRAPAEGPATASDRTVTLRVDEEGALPDGYRRYVLDLSRGVRITPGRTLSLAPGEERRLKVLLGTRAYAQEESEGVSLSALETDLRGSYPNPFEETATIEYVLSGTREVTLEVYNVLGQRVRTLVSGERERGLHRVAWDGENRYGERVGSGVYFCRIEAGDFTETQKMVLVR